MRPFSLIFWAILCVLSGIVLLIRQFTPLTFHPFRGHRRAVYPAVGVSLLITPSASKGSGRGNTTLFGQGGVSYSASGEHNCIFGQSMVDLTALPPAAR